MTDDEIKSRGDALAALSERERDRAMADLQRRVIHSFVRGEIAGDEVEAALLGHLWGVAVLLGALSSSSGDGQRITEYAEDFLRGGITSGVIGGGASAGAVLQ